MEVSREERCDLGQLLSVLGTEKGRKVSGNRTSMRVAQCYKETSFNKVPEHGCHFFLSTASPIEYASCKSVKTNLVSLNIRAKICRFLYVRVNMYKYCLFFFSRLDSHSGKRPPHFWPFSITFRHTTVGRTPLDEGSARHRDLYLTTHNTHNRQLSMSSALFKPANPASERPQTRALDRAATGINYVLLTSYMYCR